MLCFGFLILTETLMCQPLVKQCLLSKELHSPNKQHKDTSAGKRLEKAKKAVAA